MGIKIQGPHTPSTRHCATSDFSEVTLPKREKALSGKLSRRFGHNNRGVITSRFRGGGHKRVYRHVNFHRNYRGVPASVIGVAYDPDRTAHLALLSYPDGKKEYILQPSNVQTGQQIASGFDAPLEPGNALNLKSIPLGMEIHNIELRPGAGGQLVRSAGAAARIMAKEGNYATVRLPSGETRLLSLDCWATIGRVGNTDYGNQQLGKAGRKRWLGKRPHVRGSVMNPCDHPHGGGEGRSPVGRAQPMTPWGRVALGQKTRKRKKYSDSSIIRNR